MHTNCLIQILFYPYLCVLWVKFKNSVGKSVNNYFRIPHNLNMRYSASGSDMFVLNNVPAMYRKSVYNFMKRIHSSVNLIIMTIVNFYCESTLLVLWRQHLYT